MNSFFNPLNLEKRSFFLNYAIWEFKGLKTGVHKNRYFKTIVVRGVVIFKKNLKSLFFVE